MIAKELRDVQLIVAGLPLFVALLLISIPPYVDLAEMSRAAPGRAVGILLTAFGENGGRVLALLAGGLGVGLVSGEVSRGTSFLLLSKSVGCTRLLLTKYAVRAGALLTTAGFGGVVVAVYAGVRGFPFSLSVLGIALSAVRTQGGYR